MIKERSRIIEIVLLLCCIMQIMDMSISIKKILFYVDKSGGGIT